MKKKGLIISTVVMVVVLIASLTTATYAWFSSTASAAVDEMTISTASSDGLTIATYDGTSYYNAEVALGTVNSGTPGVWTGSAVGFGSNLVFDTTGMRLWGTSGNGFDMLTAGEQSGSVEGSAAKKLYKATENYDYYSAVIALQCTQTTDNAENILGEVTFKADGPMAAAARIGVFAYNGTGAPAAADLNDATKWTEKYVLAPYGKAAQSGPTWFNNGNTTGNYMTVTAGETASYTTALDITKVEKTSAFTNLIVDETEYDETNSATNTSANETVLGQVQTQGDILYIKLVVWFDGEDAQCDPNGASTGITISINFTKVAAA